MGIPAGEPATIGEPFVRRSRMRRGAGGSGLGLAIGRKIVLAHCGSIGAYNNALGGATCEVLLPRGL